MHNANPVGTPLDPDIKLNQIWMGIKGDLKELYHDYWEELQ